MCKFRGRLPTVPALRLQLFLFVFVCFVSGQVKRFGAYFWQPLSFAHKSSTNLSGWGEGGPVTSVGWQITLCDVIPLTSGVP